MTTTLYRPVGPQELELIRASGNRRFPALLHHQPLFCPLPAKEDALAIASEWAMRDGRLGFVTRFEVDAAYLARHPVQTSAETGRREHWIPAEELDRFNAHIVGTIQVVATLRPPPRTRSR